MMRAKHILSCFMALVSLATICRSVDTGIYPYKTKFGKQIECKNVFIADSQGRQVVIEVCNHEIFKTQKDATGGYEKLLFAGDPYAHGAAQIVTNNGAKTCYRWVVRVGFSIYRKYYIIDFTDPSPFVVGPFSVPDDSDEVQSVHWGKIYALIKFRSLRSFKYYYKERTVVED